MGWPLKLLGEFDHYPSYEDLTPEGATEIVPVDYGDCFLHSAFGPAESLGDHYKRDWTGKRLPLCVFTPGGWWCPDQMAYSNMLGYHGEGWKVVGDLPLITATPSINIIGLYHGFITAGILTADCEGRTFTERIRRR